MTEETKPMFREKRFTIIKTREMSQVKEIGIN
jgi:hypothetical protein